MGVEHVHRVVGDDVPALARQLGDEPEMPAEHRKPEVEPLLNAATVFGANDRRRAKSQRHAALVQSLLQRANSRERRRRMTKERIETDLGRAGFARRVARPRCETPARSARTRGSSAESDVGRMRNGCDRSFNVHAPLSEPGFARPVAAQHELFDGLLAKVILLAHGEKEPVADTGHVDSTENERRVAEATKLIAERA